METSFPRLEEIMCTELLTFWGEGYYTLFYVIISGSPNDGKCHEEGKIQERDQGGVGLF